MNQENLSNAIQARENTISLLSKSVDADLSLVVKVFNEVIQQGGTILTMGNGGSAAQAEHLSTELMVRFSRNRVPISSVCLSSSGVLLTAHGNDFNFETIYSRQIQALASSSDLCIAFSTSGKSPNIIAAAKTAQDIGVPFVLFTGDLRPQDLPFSKMIVVNVPTKVTALIQEMHLILLHIICQEIDESFED
jgi:D-sedoheptulose 7-phosphate isomerase